MPTPMDSPYQPERNSTLLPTGGGTLGGGPVLGFFLILRGRAPASGPKLVLSLSELSPLSNVPLSKGRRIAGREKFSFLLSLAAVRITLETSETSSSESISSSELIGRGLVLSILCLEFRDSLPLHGVCSPTDKNSSSSARALDFSGVSGNSFFLFSPLFWCSSILSSSTSFYRSLTILFRNHSL